MNNQECVCPHCGQKLPVDNLAVEIERIKSWCTTNGINLAFGDSLRQSHAAQYLDRSHKTLMNWCSIEGVIPVKRLRGRVYYQIEDLAKFIIKEDSR